MELKRSRQLLFLVVSILSILARLALNCDTPQTRVILFDTHRSKAATTGRRRFPSLDQKACPHVTNATISHA